MLGSENTARKNFGKEIDHWLDAYFVIAFTAAVAFYLVLVWVVARVAEEYTALVGVGGLVAILALASLLT